MSARPLLARPLLPLLAAAAAAATPAPASAPDVHAVVGARIVTAPGRELEGATIVLRDGLIEAVGRSVAAPPDARVIDGTGLWIYPGLIDPHREVGGGGPPEGGEAGPGRPRGRATEPPSGAVHPISRVTPERRAIDQLRPFDGDEVKDHRDLGFTAALLAPSSGIFQGRSAVILLQDDVPVSELVLRADVAQHVAFDRGRFGEGYPTSLMGAVATIRQALLDAKRHAEWSRRYARSPRGLERPDHVPAFDALAPLLAGEQPAFFHAASPEDVLLADDLADEFGLKAVIHGSGHEWEIADQVAATDRPLVLSLSVPDEPEVDDEIERLDVSLRQMRRFLNASAAPARLHEAGVRFAFTTAGLSPLSKLGERVRAVMDEGLPEETALAALTTVPAELVGIDAVAGTLERGKLANLVITDGPLFGEKTKVRHVFVEGVQYRMKEKEPLPGADPNAVVDPRGEWTVLYELGPRTVERKWTIEGEPGDWSGTAEIRDGTVEFDSVELAGNVLTVVLPGRGGRGPTEVQAVLRGDKLAGSMDMGRRSVTVKGTRSSTPDGGDR